MWPLCRSEELHFNRSRYGGLFPLWKGTASFGAIVFTVVSDATYCGFGGLFPLWKGTASIGAIVFADVSDA